MKPFVKWVGGKAQLLPVIRKKLPASFGTYYEPFVGGGAVLLDIAPQHAVINDINSQLINCYRQIATNYDKLVVTLYTLQVRFNNLPTDERRSEFFYNARKFYNDRMFVDLNEHNAALFIFLNKTCFNGLYRTNRKGLFNTPFGKKKRINLCDDSGLKSTSELLSRLQILNTDFGNVCDTAKPGDFVFFDSPYYDTFDAYQKGGFSTEDHTRLFRLFSRLSDNGIKCMLTNSNTDFIKDLYKNYNIECVGTRRAINSDATNRVGEDLIITNY